MVAVATHHLRRRPWLSLPRGHRLPESAWQPRHRFIMGLGAAHAIGLPLFGLYMGEPRMHAALEGTIIVALLGLALLARSRTMQATFAALALVASSAILVHFSGGYIEAHFHFFVALAFITLYQEWAPFAATVCATVLHHGAVGILDPAAVYNHPAALANPWTWALIHGAFVLAASIAYVVQWRLNEDARDEADVVLKAAGEAIVGVDGSRRIMFSNPAAVRLFKTRHLEGRRIEALLGPCHGLGVATRHVEETQILGHGLPVEVVSSPIMQGGLVAGHVLTVADIRQRRHAEEERLRHRDAQLQRMRELDNLKTSFINTVAHELRTPMTPLRLQAGMLRRMDPGPDTQKAVEMLDRNLVRLNRLMDDVLDVAQLQAGRLRLRKQDIDLCPVVEKAAEAMRPRASENRTVLGWFCPAGLRVHADDERLGQALQTLIAHAIRSAPGGHVSVSVEAAQGSAVLRIRDDGAGMTDQQLALLFQPFGHGVEDAGPREGTGLGMYLTRELVRLHRGRITAASAGPGRGAVFTVALPLVMARIVSSPLMAR